MSSNTSNEEWDETPAHGNPRNDKRWYSVRALFGGGISVWNELIVGLQIMFRVFLKVAQVVVQSRIDTAPLMKGNEKKSNWVGTAPSWTPCERSLSTNCCYTTASCELLVECYMYHFLALSLISSSRTTTRCCLYLCAAAVPLCWEAAEI